MGVLTFRLAQHDAEASAAHLRKTRSPGLRHLLAALEAGLQRPARRKEKAATLGLPARRPPRAASWATRKLRRAVWERSEGQCENDECLARITWTTFELDHFLGRARAPQKPENCWALCGDCHRKKHAGEPSRLWWLEKFLAFIRVRFAASPMVSKLEGQVEGERLLAQAEALRRSRTDGGPQDRTVEDNPSPTDQRERGADARVDPAGDGSVRQRDTGAGPAQRITAPTGSGAALSTAGPQPLCECGHPRADHHGKLPASCEHGMTDTNPMLGPDEPGYGCRCIGWKPRRPPEAAHA